MSASKVYVGNLAWVTDEESLAMHFAKVGRVKEAVVMKSDKRSRGFGFVTFTTPEEAERAIATMTETELHGRRIRVNVANLQVRTGDMSGHESHAAGGVSQRYAPPSGGFVEGSHYGSAYGGGYPVQHPPPAGGGYMYGMNAPPMMYSGTSSLPHEAGSHGVVGSDSQKVHGTGYAVPPYGYPPTGYGQPPY